jgi:hypothetical protein
MATKDKLKIMLSFMRELNDGNIPSAKDYEIDNDEYADIIEACQDAGYIKGAAITRAGAGNKVAIMWLDQVKLTVRGMEYLHEHSPLMQTYKGLKELRDWLPW